MKGKIQTCAQLLALCGLLSCGGGGAEVPPAGAGAGDSLTVCGSVSRGFVEAADSARVALMPFADPFARSGGGAKEWVTFPIGADGRFSCRMALPCPQLCLVGIGGMGDASAGAVALFFLSPGDSLRVEAEWRGGKLEAAYAGAVPEEASVEDIGRAQEFFVKHINDFASLTDMPAQREECLAGLRALQEEREAMELPAVVDDYLRLQLNVSALSVLALAGGVDSTYFAFLREFDLGNRLCPSTYFYYPAMTNLIRNAAFGLPDIGGMPPEEWMARAKRALGAYIPAERDAAYALLTAVVYCNQLHAGKPFSPKQREAIRAFFAPGRHGLGNVAARLLAESDGMGG
ncbi:MAG: hypothetical protein ACOYJE_01040 [Bacteroidaceae bacterium]|jgi:hypothetical protein